MHLGSKWQLPIGEAGPQIHFHLFLSSLAFDANLRLLPGTSVVPRSCSGRVQPWRAPIRQQDWGKPDMPNSVYILVARNEDRYLHVIGSRLGHLARNSVQHQRTMIILRMSCSWGACMPPCPRNSASQPYLPQATCIDKLTRISDGGAITALEGVWCVING